MTIISTTISSTASGTYGISNDLIGQIKTILQNDPHVTILSDNDPGPETARILTYKISYNNHKLILNSERYYYGNAAGIGVTIRNAADSADLHRTHNFSDYISGTSYPVVLLYNSKFHVLLIEQPAWRLEKAFTLFDVGDPTGWYVWSCAMAGEPNNDANTVWKANSDTKVMIQAPAYMGTYPDGSFITVPIRFKEYNNDMLLSSYYNKILLSCPYDWYQWLLPFDSGVHHDASNTAFLVYANEDENSGFIIPDVD